MLLPPSETKTEDGGEPPLDLNSLSFPELDPVREKLLSAGRYRRYGDGTVSGRTSHGVFWEFGWSQQGRGVQVHTAIR